MGKRFGHSTLIAILVCTLALPAIAAPGCWCDIEPTLEVEIACQDTLETGEVLIRGTVHVAVEGQGDAPALTLEGTTSVGDLTPNTWSISIAPGTSEQLEFNVTAPEGTESVEVSWGITGSSCDTEDVIDTEASVTAVVTYTEQCKPTAVTMAGFTAGTPGVVYALFPAGLLMWVTVKRRRNSLK